MYDCASDGNTREEKGKSIVKRGNQIINIDDIHFKVKSRSGKRYYDVELTEDGVTCSCPDKVSQGEHCKHIHAIKFYLEDYYGSPKESITEKKEFLTYTQAWSTYNGAQTEEIRLFEILLIDLLASISEWEQTMGRPRISLRESLFCAIQKVYSQLSSRRAYGLYRNAADKGQLDHAPHFNTPSKIFNDPEITPILEELVTLSSLPVAKLETDFAVDSTGFSTTTFGSYYAEKYNKKREHHWLKAHIASGIKTNIVTGIIISSINSGDSPKFKPLIEKTAEHFDINEIVADKAYSSRDNLKTVNNIGGTAYIPFKNNATGRWQGSIIWNKMYHYFQYNKDDFMKHYHKRSNIESTNAAIKRKFGETLKSKNPTAQVNELLAKIVAYNLTVVIHEMYENGIEPHFILEKP